MTELIVVATGTANIASVESALHRLGARCRRASEPADIEGATAVVLPGVGTYRAAMRQLDSDGLVDALRAHVRDRRPTLAVCLGFQLLFAGSEESGDVAGLGLWRGRVERLPGSVRRPHLGWNEVEPTPGCRWLTPGEAYFAHSFWVRGVESQAHRGETVYAERFVAAIEDGGILATQYHPELSGAWGAGLLERWLGSVRC